MNNNKVGDPVFILGAGFNIDAISEVGKRKSLPISGYTACYPLVSDLLKVCFSLERLPDNFNSIEELFQDSIKRGDNEPLKKLYTYLMELDYELIWPITHNIIEKKNCDNAYIKFLRNFKKSHLITFNYDSLPEILLLADDSWFPGDGYGVPVQFLTDFCEEDKLTEKKSLRYVLHLHGSLCVYTEDFSIKKQLLQECEPKFLFDPDRNEQCFAPFTRVFPSITSYNPDLSKRIIAPIPDKADGLREAFIKAMYKRSVEFLNNANQIIVIGYSFNPYDHESYNKLLVPMVGKSVLLVAPNADKLKRRFDYEYFDIHWDAQNMSFKEWVEKGYPGIS